MGLPRRGAINKIVAMGTDTHEMVIIHRFFRREMGLLPTLVMTVPAGDTGRAAIIARHGRDLLDALHVHHTGEDEFLWPPLLERASPATELIDRMERQHADVDAAIGSVRDLLARWAAGRGQEIAAQLANEAEKLGKLLSAHFDEEEERILPLAAAHLSPAEWARLGKHGVSHTPRHRLLRQLGQILEDTSPGERRDFLSKLPPPPRILWAIAGSRGYARYTRTIRAGLPD